MEEFKVIREKIIINKELERELLILILSIKAKLNKKYNYQCFLTFSYHDIYYRILEEIKKGKQNSPIILLPKYNHC